MSLIVAVNARSVDYFYDKDTKSFFFNEFHCFYAVRENILPSVTIAFASGPALDLAQAGLRET